MDSTRRGFLATAGAAAAQDLAHAQDHGHSHQVVPSDLALRVKSLESLLNGALSDHFNVGTGVGHSVREVIATVEEVTGKRVPFVIGPRREGDPPALVADSGKLQRTLGWKPRNAGLRGIVAIACEFEKNRAGVK